MFLNSGAAGELPPLFRASDFATQPHGMSRGLVVAVPPPPPSDFEDWLPFLRDIFVLMALTAARLSDADKGGPENRRVAHKH